MPITNVNRGGSDSGANRTTFRPPWVKPSSEAAAAAPAQPSWVKKKTSDTTAPSTSSASTTAKPAVTTTQTKQSTTPSKTTTVTSKAAPDTTTKDTAATFASAPKKTNTTIKTPVSAVKKEFVPSPSNTIQKDAKLQSREVKVPVMTERRPSQPVHLKPVLKKVAPKVESSSEEETEDEEEEYTDEEVEEEEEEEEMDDEMAEMERLLEEARKEAAKSARDERMKKELAEKSKADKLMVKLKPVLKKTPTIDEIPKEKPKSFLETPKLRKVVKNTDQILEKPAKPKLEMPALKKVVKKDSPVVVKGEPEWKSEAVLNPVKNVPPPPPPPMNGCPPPPPPPPGMMTAAEKKDLTEKQKATLEKLKTRPRRRPDWSDMMAEVEQGRKLKKVQCNDRSQPILTCKSMAKVDGQFIFETEKDEKASKHNEMLKQIQFGIKLKPTKTNDRSKPELSGLRKFRKQMTIEEQIKKSESRATMPVDAPVEDEEDEMDDIDRLRDDLQSTKQMLSQELRNKEAQERENKRLLAKIQQMEAELEREKNKSGGGDAGDSTTVSTSSGSGSDEALVKALKQEAADAQKTSKDLEKKYNAIAEQLDSAKSEIEEKNRKIAALEKQLSQTADLWDSDEDSHSNYYLQRTRSKGPGGYGNRRESEAVTRDSSPEPEPEVSEGDDDEDEEKKAERKKRKVAREVRLMRSKLTRLKGKEEEAKQEQTALKMAKKTQQLIMKEEKKKYKALQKEVNKMAKLMADEDDEDEDEESEKPPAEESEAEEEDSDESDNSDSDEDDDSESESEEEDAPEEDKKTNLEPRVKRHEGILAALKKSNVLHQANVDRVKDEINKQRELSDQLQHDLDSVLSELG